MDWNTNLRGLVSRPPGPDISFNFLYNYNYDQLPGMEMKHPTAVTETFPGMEKLQYYVGSNLQERKKRLTSEQLGSLERSFQEEIKLDPDRKMKLSRELGLQPRQIAIWFQNRRARWKTKQLERLYDALKLEFDAVSKEKHRLQEEVIKLKAMLRDEATRKPMSYTDISGDETVESTSVAIWSSGRPPRGSSGGHHNNQPIGECNYLMSVDECNPVPSPYWVLPVLPSYPS